MGAELLELKMNEMMLDTVLLKQKKIHQQEKDKRTTITSHV